jgi:hypothetical protein
MGKIGFAQTLDLDQIGLVEDMKILKRWGRVVKGKSRIFLL